MLVAEGPILLLGADSYGRDIFSRLVYGARASLGLAALATLAASRPVTPDEWRAVKRLLDAT